MKRLRLGAESVELLAELPEQRSDRDRYLVLGRRRGSALLAHHPGCAALFVEPAGRGYHLTPTQGLPWQPA